jgi:hypothetical protein
MCLSGSKRAWYYRVPETGLSYLRCCILFKISTFMICKAWLRLLRTFGSLFICTHLLHLHLANDYVKYRRGLVGAWLWSYFILFHNIFACIPRIHLTQVELLGSCNQCTNAAFPWKPVMSYELVLHIPHNPITKIPTGSQVGGYILHVHTHKLDNLFACDKECPVHLSTFWQ